MRRALLCALVLALAGDALARPTVRARAASRPCFGATLPTIRAVGAITSGQGTLAPAYPANTVAGDLVLMFCANSGEGEQTASGWTAAASVSGSGVWHTVLYRVLSSNTDATTTNDVGDMQACRTIGVTAGTFCAAQPIDIAVTSTQAATTSIVITGGTTSRNNSLCFQSSGGDGPDTATTSQFSSPANASLGSVTERIDNTRSDGTGTALFAMSGTKATCCTINDGTATAGASWARANATVCINGR